LPRGTGVRGGLGRGSSLESIISGGKASGEVLVIDNADIGEVLRILEFLVAIRLVRLKSKMMIE